MRELQHEVNAVYDERLWYHVRFEEIIMGRITVITGASSDWDAH